MVQPILSITAQRLVSEVLLLPKGEIGVLEGQGYDLRLFADRKLAVGLINFCE